MKIDIKTCGECPLFDAENRECLIAGDEDGAICAHVRNEIIRRCHEWMQKQEEGK